MDTTHIFATNHQAAADEREALSVARFKDLQASLTRLVKNKDFHDFYLYLAYEFCSADFGVRPLSAEVQGVRMAMAKINETLAIADKGPELIAEATRKHFTAVGESISRSRLSTRKTKEKNK